jgi:hypothetical protein
MPDKPITDLLASIRRRAGLDQLLRANPPLSAKKAHQLKSVSAGLARLCPGGETRLEVERRIREAVEAHI